MNYNPNNMTIINPSQLTNPARLSNTGLINHNMLANTYTPMDLSSAITSNRDRSSKKEIK